MLGALLTRSMPKRLARGVPVARLLLAAEVAVMAGRHLARLDGTQRRRLLTLLGRSRGRPSTLRLSERRELSALIARLEPRLFMGLTLKRLSPVPLPKRLLYGPRDSLARRALAERN